MFDKLKFWKRGKKMGDENQQETKQPETQQSSEPSNVIHVPHIPGTVTTDKGPEIPKVPEHEHKWQRGMLPGQKYIVTCLVPGCGQSKDVTFEEWAKHA